MTKINDDYTDLSALDAPTILTNTLRHFFSNNRNVYEYGLAHKHFMELEQKSDFATSKTLFEIIMGTNLVANKLITSYKTDQGFRYLIKKDYFQQVERMIRTNNRSRKRMDSTTPRSSIAHTTPKRSPSTTTLSPFIQAMQDIDDTSSDENTQSDDESATAKTIPESFPDTTHESTPIVDNTQPSQEQDQSITSDITQQAADLERNLTIALEDLKDPDDDHIPPDHLTPLISKLLDEKLEPVFRAMTDKEKLLETRSVECLDLSNKLTFLIASTNTLHSKLKEQHDKMAQKMNYLHRKITESEKVLTDFKINRDKLLDDIQQQQLVDARTPNTPMNNNELQNVASKSKR